jgi:hypothetical protein
MSRNMMTKTALAALLGAPLLLGACASKDDVAKAQDTADRALASAQQANSTAQQAMQTAQAANERAMAGSSYNRGLRK